ncbi:hypothetical protein G6F22_019285 [Rhizopus arrhizus]|nr:hypothetical protein G6F22_019285 [Rhizopus arrhizus]
MQQASNNLTYSGRCRFGAGELTSITWMPRLIEEIQRAHPNLLVEPYVGVGELVERGLEEGDLDFARGLRMGGVLPRGARPGGADPGRPAGADLDHAAAKLRRDPHARRLADRTRRITRPHPMLQ